MRRGSTACRRSRCGWSRPPRSPPRSTPARSTSASPARTCCASWPSDLGGVMLHPGAGLRPRRPGGGRAEELDRRRDDGRRRRGGASLPGAHRPAPARRDQVPDPDPRLLRPPRHHRLPHRRVGRRDRGRAGGRRGGTGRRHHHHRRDAGGQRAEGARRRPDPLQPGAARRQPGGRLGRRAAGRGAAPDADPGGAGAGQAHRDAHLAGRGGRRRTRCAARLGWPTAPSHARSACW